MVDKAYITNEEKVDNKNLKKYSPFPVLFISVILIISVLNISNFYSTYKQAVIENPNDKKVALSLIEGKYSANFLGKTNYIDLNSAFARLLNKKELNITYRLNNGYLVDNAREGSNNKITDIENLSNLKKYLDDKEISFAYIQTPSAILTDDDEMIPKGYDTYLNRNIDVLLTGLENEEVKYLDLRENVTLDDLSSYDLFYKADHHWNTYGSFWAHKHVVNFVSEQIESFEINEEYFDENNYNFKELNCYILGSLANRTGVFFGEPDRICAITPKYETKFHIEDKSRNLDKVGDFNDTLTCFDRYNVNGIVTSPEAIYLGPNYEYKKIENLNAKNDIKVMLINDSYSLTLAPFLALHFKEIHMYDLRSRFGGSEEGFIEKLNEIKPDIVLQVKNTSNALPDEIIKTLKDNEN